MRVREWAGLNGWDPQTVWKWCRTDRMPVPYETLPNGRYDIHDPKCEKQTPVPDDTVTVCYARVSSSDQRGDLQRQADRLKAFALNMGEDDARTVMEVGSGMNEHRRKLNRILADPHVGTIIVEHRDRLARMNFELVENALKARGCRVIVIDDTEVKDDLVRDITEFMTSVCARLYGSRSARHRAERGLEAMRDDA